MSDESPKPAPLLPKLARALGLRETASEEELTAQVEYMGPLEKKYLDALEERDGFEALARRLYQLQRRRAAADRAAAQPGQVKD